MKGQAAMEYLMTYGWAILIVIAVVAALYAMGVFRIGGAPVACSPCFSEFAFNGYTKSGTSYSTGGGALMITTGPEEINITSVSASGGSVANGFYMGGSWHDSSSIVVPPSTRIELINITNTTGSRVILTVMYIVTRTGYSYTTTATINN
jgi:hypothetical protein